MSFKIKKHLNKVKIIILALILSGGISIVFAAWTDPTEPFPDGNVPAPINVGSDIQTKVGSLWAGFLGTDTGFYAGGNAEIVGNTKTDTLTVEGGSPASGKVLMSQNADGDAQWSDQGLNCQTKTASASSANTVSVSCPTANIAVGGGGDCATASITSSKPDGQGWEIQCSASGDISANVICCAEKFIQVGGSPL